MMMVMTFCNIANVFIKQAVTLLSRAFSKYTCVVYTIEAHKNFKLMIVRENDCNLF